MAGRPRPGIPQNPPESYEKMVRTQHERDHPWRRWGSSLPRPKRCQCDDCTTPVHGKG